MEISFIFTLSLHLICTQSISFSFPNSTVGCKERGKEKYIFVFSLNRVPQHGEDKDQWHHFNPHGFSAQWQAENSLKEKTQTEILLSDKLSVAT